MGTRGRTKEYIFSKNHDAAGRLTSATAGDFTTTISHDGFGRKQTVSHSNGTTGNFQFDLLNRLTGLQWSGATPISEALGYDLAGNITTLERENGSYQIAYDAIDQLVSSTSTGTNLYNRNFTFDLLGNRVASSVDGPGSFVNNFLTSNNSSSFMADPNGFGETVQETTAGVTTNFTYRADGLLNGVQKGSMQAAYYFDALGRRVAKVINFGSESFTQSFLHLGLEDRILQAKAGDGSITTYVDGQGVDEHLFEVKNGIGKGYEFDHLQSILNGDAAGPAKAFHLYGEQIVTPVISAASSPVMYGYTGREHDAESGLDYHRARTRNKQTSSWLSQDPIGLDGSDENFLRYGFNRPTLFTDPNGLDVWIEGPNGREPPAHQAVCVGSPTGAQRCFSYALGAGPWGLGGIYEDTDTGGEVQDYKVTSEEQDLAIINRLARLKAEQGISIYGVNDVCRSFSQREFSRVEALPGPPNMRPPRSTPPMWKRAIGWPSSISKWPGTSTFR